MLGRERSCTPNLTELLAEKCDIKVRKGALRQDMLLDVASQSKSADYLQILGLLYSGRENCVEVIARPAATPEVEPQVEEEEEPVDPREQRAREKEEQERRKRAEKERRKREAEEAKKREKERKEKEKANKPGLFGKLRDMVKKAETLLDDENDNY